MCATFVLTISTLYWGHIKAMLMKGNEKRTLDKWIVRLAYELQLSRQQDYIYEALINEEDADLDLQFVSDNLAKKAKMRAYNLFESMPQELLDTHNISKEQSDFERLYALPLNKYILFNDEQLNQLTW